MLVFFPNLSLMEFLVSIWPYFTVFLFFSNRRLQVVLNRKSPQEYPVNAGLPLGSILGLTLFRLCMIDLHDDVICNLAL